MSYVVRDDMREIDGATLVKLMQRVRDREKYWEKWKDSMKD